MGDAGSEGMVDPGEDLERFENMGRSSQSTKKGGKIFKIYDFENCRYFLVTPYLLVCFWRENVAEHSTKCSARTPTSQ